jgi:hypothetical protein
MKKFLTLFLVLSLSIGLKAQDTIRVKNQVFEILYSQNLEQPLWIKYKSTNRPTNVNRGSMDFYKEPNIKTSDGEDYKSNVYDKVKNTFKNALSINIKKDYINLFIEKTAELFQNINNNFTGIIYLNDNYEGGETVIEDRIITPAIGKFIFFQGSKLTHRVNEIVFGSRYTIPCWFKII